MDGWWFNRSARRYRGYYLHVFVHSRIGVLQRRALRQATGEAAVPTCRQWLAAVHAGTRGAPVIQRVVGASADDR